MNKDDANKSLDIVGHWLHEISVHNDLTKNTTKNLKTIMFTLLINADKIEDPNIKAAIKIIAKEFENGVRELNTSITNLINNGRDELHSEFTKIFEYINED